MEFQTLLEKRRSIREFSCRPVELSKLIKVLDSAAYAASAMNQQSWFFVLIDNAKIIEDLAFLMDSRCEEVFYGAKQLILMFAKDDNIAPLIDTSLAASNMMYQACELGLGTCWIHQVKDVINDPRYSKLKEKLAVPNGYSCIGSLAIGYYDITTPRPSKRKHDYYAIVK